MFLGDAKLAAGLCQAGSSLVFLHELTKSQPFDNSFLLKILLDDGKLVAESDSGEFWVLFGGFAPIGKKPASEDDAVLEKTPPKLYRYFFSFITLIRVYARL